MKGPGRSWWVDYSAYVEGARHGPGRVLSSHAIRVEVQPSLHTSVINEAFSEATGTL